MGDAKEEVPMVKLEPGVSLGESIVKGTKSYKSTHVLIKPIELAGHDLDRPRSVVCLSNGFKGPYIAGFLKTHFKDFFVKACEELKFTDSEAEEEVADYQPVLERTISLLNTKVDGSSKSLVQGASFSVCLQAGDKIFTANVGDNQIFIITKSTCFVASDGHTPLNTEEKHRLGDLGVHVNLFTSKRKNSICGGVETFDDIDEGELTITRCERKSTHRHTRTHVRARGSLNCCMLYTSPDPDGFPLRALPQRCPCVYARSLLCATPRSRR